MVNHEDENAVPPNTPVNSYENQLHQPDPPHTIRMSEDDDGCKSRMMIMSKEKLIRLKPPKPANTTKRKYVKSKGPKLKGQLTISNMLQPKPGSGEPRFGHKPANNVNSKFNNKSSQAFNPIMTLKKNDYRQTSESATNTRETDQRRESERERDKDNGGKR